MKIGFTGTRKGLTPPQYLAVKSTLIALPNPTELHFGDCVGADEQLYYICVELFNTVFIGHPPDKKVLRANLIYSILYPTKPFLERNKDIVYESDLLIACPESKVEKLRSGTWATIRYARKQKIPIKVIYPDGTYLYENPA